MLVQPIDSPVCPNAIELRHLSKIGGDWLSSRPMHSKSMHHKNWSIHSIRCSCCSTNFRWVVGLVLAALERDLWRLLVLVREREVKKIKFNLLKNESRGSKVNALTYFQPMNRIVFADSTWWSSLWLNLKLTASSSFQNDEMHWNRPQMRVSSVAHSSFSGAMYMVAYSECPLTLKPVVWTSH